MRFPATRRLALLPLSPTATALLGIFAGCCMDALIKSAGAHYAAVTIVFFRMMFAAPIAIGVFVASGRALPSAEAFRAHLVRGGVIACAASCFFYSITVLPLVEAILIGFLAILLVAPIAFVILKEPPGRLSLIAIGIGFVGVCITAWPPGGDPSQMFQGRALGYAAALVSAFAYALSLVLLRGRAGRDGVIVTSMFQNTLPAFFLAPFVLAIGQTPKLADLPHFALIGLCGLTLSFMLASAYKRAPAHQMAPLEYSALLWAGLFGFFLFKEVPSANSFLGGAAILSACLLAGYDEAKSRKSAQAPL